MVKGDNDVRWGDPVRPHRCNRLHDTVDGRCGQELRRRCLQHGKGALRLWVNPRGSRRGPGVLLHVPGHLPLCKPLGRVLCRWCARGRHGLGGLLFPGALLFPGVGLCKGVLGRRGRLWGPGLVPLLAAGAVYFFSNADLRSNDSCCSGAAKPHPCILAVGEHLCNRVCRCLLPWLCTESQQCSSPALRDDRSVPNYRGTSHPDQAPQAAPYCSSADSVDRPCWRCPPARHWDRRSPTRHHHPSPPCRPQEDRSNWSGC
mmetsp:Transcript_5900/g.10811  ORF Transcript_5900/g.10811 Transcript_5900/m.10811 type:complete len:259 (-) Transcript_5900:1649-2425(-)